MEHSECGLACLAMVLGFYGHHVTLPEMRNRMGTTRTGVSMHQVQEMASMYHLKTRGYRLNLSQLNQLTPPLILFWENKHFVVLERLSKHKAVILDPALGRLVLSLKELEEKFSGFCLSFIPEEGFERRRPKHKWLFFLRLALKSRKLPFAILIISLLLQGLGLLIPLLTQWSIDRLTGKNGSFLTILGGVIAGLFIFSQLFQLLRGYLVAKLQSKMDTSMMSEFIERLFKLPFEFFENRKGGELVFRANSNVIIRRVLSNRVVTLFIDGLLLVTYAALMVTYNWQMGLMVIGVGLLMLSIIFVSSFISHRLSRNEISAQAEMHGFLAENIQGIMDLKVLGAEEQVFDKWWTYFQQQLKTTEKRTVWTASIDSISASIQSVFPLLLLWAGSYYVLQGNMTLGSLLGFQSLAVAFMMPIVSLGSTYNELVSVGSYIQRLQDVIESKPEQMGIYKSRETFRGDIEVIGVSFHYHRFGKDVLKDIHLRVYPGERVAIVGASGSGKSTLAKLLLGLYTATEGQVRIDGVSLEDWNLRELRRSLGVVLQETRLFNMTIMQNIGLHQSDYTLDEIVQAARRAAIHDYIMQLPLGYQTMVSENGVNLSGGQRQRILLARALMKQPQILVLDEATSSLDTASEQLITESLREYPCTQILIAHRLSTIRHADRIVVLDQGR
ncbi:peptidase domain-containing ABC transporter, partial [Paenibacillus zanthoxyli]|uniref:peptidase domain-containing ABC transporter n=1 Tax=Paenibacillus zanthoxyli TaxID=369399 RepID=UPI00046F7226